MAGQEEVMDNGKLEKGTETPSPERRPSFFARNSTSNGAEDNVVEEDRRRPTKWAMGILNDPLTHEVPGSVLMLKNHHNAPLGFRNAPARHSSSSLPTQQPIPDDTLHKTDETGQKTTNDGNIILNPQPDESHNDPLNWASWRRDLALLSLGLYCMLGGGMTPILAAGFTNVSQTYHVSTAKVARTTGLYMMGLGVGSVFVSPTAILYGKRPVYLVSAMVFILTCIWCALSPSYNSLLIARIFQGLSLSPVECLPSATVAEIFFLHERAYRLGIYTLLLLGGKNLVPLVSAAIINSLSWRWVFWIVAMIAGFCLTLLFLFVPETFWDRSPRPRSHNPSRNHSMVSLFLHRKSSPAPDTSKVNLPQQCEGVTPGLDSQHTEKTSDNEGLRPSPVVHRHSERHVGFAPTGHDAVKDSRATSQEREDGSEPATPINLTDGTSEPAPYLSSNYLERDATDQPLDSIPNEIKVSKRRPHPPKRYTSEMRERSKLTFVQQLRPYNGRLHHDKWLRVAVRPFILFAYPAVLWSAVIYSCSVGWLIVLSESVAEVYRNKNTYNFSALSTGLIYLSPFIGGVLGTAVAGKVSDIVVKAMSRRNGGLYEPEFRLVMAAPVAISTVIGLMGFGWSAENHDAWIVPTIFFGIISFGCSLGSTTAITFCVDSYRMYAGEALVTLNFAKNIFHGLVFSLFFNNWLSSDGSKMVFIWLGIIQLIFCAFSIPMYIFGKRARMWTVRKNLMEKF